jgi:quinol monooxygenase YgiN
MAEHVIVSGHLTVAPDARVDYLQDCAGVVRAARATPGCLDFAIGADLVDPGRINVFERWDSRAAVEAFRGSGPSDEQNVAILDASVAEYDVTGDVRPLGP